jgi:hypothetical protein
MRGKTRHPYMVEVKKREYFRKDEEEMVNDVNILSAKTDEV